MRGQPAAPVSWGSALSEDGRTIKEKTDPLYFFLCQEVPEPCLASGERRIGGLSNQDVDLYYHHKEGPPDGYVPLVLWGPKGAGKLTAPTTFQKKSQRESQADHLAIYS